MRQYYVDNDHVTAFDERVYLQERNIITFQHSGGDAQYVNMWTNLHGNRLTPLATYRLGIEGRAIIDMTDYIRAYRNVTSITIECQQDSPIEITVQVGGLMRPENVLAVDNMDGVVISLPSMILAPIPLQQGVLLNEFNFMAKEEGWTIEHNRITAGVVNTIYTFMYDRLRIRHRLDVDTITVQGSECKFTRQAGSRYFWRSIKGLLIIEYNTAMRNPSVGDKATDRFGNESPIDAVTYNYYSRYVSIRPLICGHRYCAVRWVSYTGDIRISTFEVEDISIDTNDATAIINQIDDYHTIKGKEESFNLVLRDLNRYDYWYYSDLITSSDVRIKFGDEEYRQVDVLTKNATIPDGDGKLNELKINVKYRKYDAVTM